MWISSSLSVITFKLCREMNFVTEITIVPFSSIILHLEVYDETFQIYSLPWQGIVLKSDTCCCREILHAAVLQAGHCSLRDTRSSTEAMQQPPALAPQSPALACCRSLGTNAAQAASGEQNVEAGLYEFYLKTIIMYKQTKYTTEIIKSISLS